MGRLATTGRAANESGGGNDPLDYWLEQERLQGLNDDWALAGENRLPSGWWLLPAMAVALPVWSFLIWIAFLR